MTAENRKIRVRHIPCCCHLAGFGGEFWRAAFCPKSQALTPNIVGRFGIYQKIGPNPIFGPISFSGSNGNVADQ
jgi:hypothetical protein